MGKTLNSIEPWTHLTDKENRRPKIKSRITKLEFKDSRKIETPETQKKTDT